MYKVILKVKYMADIQDHDGYCSGAEAEIDITYEVYNLEFPLVYENSEYYVFKIMYPIIYLDNRELYDNYIDDYDSLYYNNLFNNGTYDPNEFVKIYRHKVDIDNIYDKGDYGNLAKYFESSGCTSGGSGYCGFQGLHNIFIYCIRILHIYDYNLIKSCKTSLHKELLN